jgi:SAM-dependent methyltransferase
MNSAMAVTTRVDELRNKSLHLREKLAKVEKKLQALGAGDAATDASPNAGDAAPPPAVLNVLDSYVDDTPSAARGFALFDGEWSSDIPGYGLGHAALFDDERITWFLQQCGGVAGKRVLELGPLEAGHTYMMARAGAARICAIESNTRAFLKCLVVQNVLKFEADFWLGDFRRYLDGCGETYDLILASGVLYHMTEPAKLLQDMARVSGSIALWTHYYDPDVILADDRLRRRFDPESTIETVGSRQIVSYRQSYLEALSWQGFCGGSAPTSRWLTRDSLLGLLTDLGFAVTVGDDSKNHTNGPAITLFAAR